MELAERRRLPDVVRARLEEHGRADRSAAADGGDPWAAVRGGRVVEARRSVLWEIRASSEDLDRAIHDQRGEVPLVGYATSYEQPYEVYGGPEYFGWNEVMATGSWSRTIAMRHDIKLLYNHDGLVVARTGQVGGAPGTLRLVSDELGVQVDSTLDMRSGFARDLAVSIQRGDLSQMSCAFEVLEQSWSPDYLERRILEVRGHDVSVVAYPANEATLVMVPGAADTGPGSAAGEGEGEGAAGDDEGASRAASGGVSLVYARAQAEALRLASATI